MAFLGDHWWGLTMLTDTLFYFSPMCLPQHAKNSSFFSPHYKGASWSPILPPQNNPQDGVPQVKLMVVDVEFCAWPAWMWHCSLRVLSKPALNKSEGCGSDFFFFSRSMYSTSQWCHIPLPLVGLKHSFFIPIQGSFSALLWIKFKIEL